MLTEVDWDRQPIFAPAVVGVVSGQYGFAPLAPQPPEALVEVRELASLETSPPHALAGAG
jgi:hypothetical protein